MIRVLQIGLSYSYGGIENLVMNYYRNIDKENIKFDFVNPYNKPLAFEEEFIKMGGVIYRIPDFHKSPLKYKKELSAIIKNYETIHIHMLSAANLIPLKLAKKYGIKKIIVHSHNTKAKGKWRTILHNINYRKIKRMANICYACSDEAGKWMYGKDVKYNVLKNAIPIDKYKFSQEKRIRIRKELGIGVNENIYGNVGRLNIQKNQLFLVKIFKELLKKQKNSYLCIVGEGELREDIISLSKEMKIQNRVLLLGNRTDINCIYSAFDSMIFPSIFEGLPISLVEAQANGLKCYVSRDNVPDEVKILDSLEFISLKKTANEWADIIFNNDNKRDIDAVRKLQKLNYDITKEYRILESEYQKL